MCSFDVPVEGIRAFTPVFTTLKVAGEVRPRGVNGHMRVQVLLRLRRVIAELTRKRPSRNVSVTNVLCEARRRLAAHFAERAFIIEHVHSHMVSQDPLRWIKLIAMRTLKTLHVYGNLPFTMHVELCVRRECCAAIWTGDKFFFSVLLHVIAKLVQVWEYGPARSPLTLDTAFNAVPARVVVRVRGHMVQIHLIVSKGLKTLFPTAEQRRGQIDYVSPFRIASASRKLDPCSDIRSNAFQLGVICMIIDMP